MNTRRPWRIATISLGIVSAALVAAPAVAAGTWYVDGSSPTCAAAGPGTQEAPFCTVSAAVRLAVSPGDTVVVAPGIYREQVTIAGSGTADAPIRILGSGPGVELRGTQDLSGAVWTPAAGSAWSTAYAPTAAPRQVFLDGARMTQAPSAAAVVPGSWSYDATARVLTVDMGGASPAGRAVEAGAQNFGVTATSRSFVEVRDLVARGQNLAGFRALTSSDIAWRGVTSVDAGSNGVLVDTSTGGAVVAGARVSGALSTGIRVNRATGSVVSDSWSHHNGLHGIGVSASPATRVQGNSTWANASVSPTATAAGIDVSQSSTDAVVIGNRSRENQDSGIQVYSGSHRTLVARNLVWRNGDHGLDTLASTDVGYLSNTSVANTRDGISIEGGSVRARTSGNILVDNGTATREYDLYVSSDSVAGFTGDHDLIANESTVPAVRFDSTLYRTLADFAAATGHETHGVGLAPGFVDAAGDDFRLAGGSPAIDAADTGVPGFVTADADGTEPIDDPTVADTGTGATAYADLGALERIPQGGPNFAPHPSLVVDPDTLAVPPSGTVTADASASSDADAAPIASYAFDFGDGSDPVSGTSPVVRHVYAAPGDFTVTLTVTDAQGAASTRTRQVRITDRPLATLVVRQGAGCSDTGAGTDAAPLCTIGAAAKRALAGDTVLVGPGVYREQVNPTATGEAGAPITYRATSPDAVVSGADDLTDAGAWTATGTGAWSYAWPSATAPRQVWVDGARLAAGTGAGTWSYDAATRTLLVDVGGANPALGHTVEASARSFAFLLRADAHTVLEGFTVEDTNLSAVYLDSSAHITLRGLRVSGAGVHGVTVDASQRVVVEDLQSRDNLSSGLRFFSSSDSSLTGALLERNGLHGASVQGSRSVTVSDVVTRLNVRPVGRGAVGVDVSQGSVDTLVERSTAYANDDSGFQSFSGSTGTVFRRNVAYDNGDHGIDTSGASGTVAVSNTLVANTTAGLNFEGGATGSTSRDNVLALNAIASPRTVGEIRVDESSVAGTTIDRDLVWNPGNTVVEWNGIDYLDLAALRAASGQQASGRQGDPAFVDLAGRDLRPGASSPAIDAADSTVAGWLRTDRAGRAPVDNPGVVDTGVGPDAVADLGALEYAGPVALGSLTPRTGPVPLVVRVDGRASRALSAALAGSVWDCGNGTSVASAVGDCTYDRTGTYRATLTVTDADGVRATWSDTVTATVNTAPVARLSAQPGTGFAPQDVVLDASRSTDSTGAITSYAFVCGNGTSVAAQAVPTATCRYPAAGTFTARVTVRDAGGLTSTASVTVRISANRAPSPVLDLSATTVRRSGGQATITASGARSSDTDNAPIASYRFTCGNGQDSGVRTTTSYACVFRSAGLYQITLRVTDTAGLTGTVSRWVLVL
ncbi:hypothetical protein GCM10027425_15680 [Alteromonas gracilis]